MSVFVLQSPDEEVLSWYLCFYNNLRIGLKMSAYLSQLEYFAVVFQAL